jgi:NAD(P)H dehydrogenase (quinone)
MSIVVTGASGHLGRLVVEQLLASGVSAGTIVAGARRTEVLDDLAARGVQVRRIDYSDPESLASGFAGADRVLIISGTEFGQRVTQHVAAAQAAKDAGASLIAYTSVTRADTTPMLLATEHRETERAIRQLGVPFTMLRNSWYLENYTDRLPTYLEHGAVIGSARDGKISAAARADYAAAAAVVLTTDGHAGATYELGGDTPFTLTELAQTVAQVSGKPVVYRDLQVEEYKAILIGTGMPEAFATVVAQVDESVAGGALVVESGDLARLIGRPAASLSDAVAAALN